MTESIDDLAALRTVYRPPAEGALAKAIDHIDQGAAGLIAVAPLFVLATTDGHSTDASPRGGPPGFVHVLPDGRLAFGDLVGNNRLDSYTNLLAHPHVGLLFLVPGMLETVRVNGRASLTTDPELCARCAIDGRLPKVVVVVDVDECFVHCGAALRRSSLWDTDTWPSRQDRPSAAAVLRDHVGIDATVEEIEADLEGYYDHGIWYPGGGDPGE